MPRDCAVRVRISGRVQGVWYRAWTENRARDHCLDGWVRNCSDGTVEAVFAGPEPQVERMIERCHEGPPTASVDHIERESVDAGPLIGQGFRKLPTD